MQPKAARRVAIICGVAALSAGIVSGCSSDNSSSDHAAATTTSVAAAATAANASGTTADAATTKEITDAYVTFFDGKTPVEQRTAVVEKGQVFTPVLQAQASNPQQSGTSVKVASVHVTAPTQADVDYTLYMNGSPVLPDQSGQAVKADGHWLVSASTFCALMAIQGGTSPAC